MVRLVQSSLAVRIAVASLFLHAAQAQAGAFFVGEISARAIGRGGANLVNPGDPSAVWLNPAAMALASGVQLQLHSTWTTMNSQFVRDCGPDETCAPIAQHQSYGQHRYDTSTNRPGFNENAWPTSVPPTSDFLGRGDTPSRFTDGDPIVNQAPALFVPNIFATANLDIVGVDGLAFGFGLFGPNAGLYEYPADGAQRYDIVNQRLLEIYYVFGGAWRIADWIAVGATFQRITAGLKQDVVVSADLHGNEDPESDIMTRVGGTDEPGGLDFMSGHVLDHLVPSGSFGVWIQPLKGLEWASSVQLGRQIVAEGPIALELGPQIKSYQEAGLLDVKMDNPRAKVSFTMPPFYRTGIKYGTDLFDGLMGFRNPLSFEIEGDFVYEQWSAFDMAVVESTGIDFVIGGGEPAPLEPVVIPRNWVDSWSIRLGGELHFFDHFLQVRSGGFYETAAMPNETYSLALTNGEKVGFGCGASLRYAGLQVDAGYAKYMLFDRVVGDESLVHSQNVMSTPNSELRTRTAMGTYSAGYDQFTVALTVAFDEMLGLGNKKAVWEEKPAFWPELD